PAGAAVAPRAAGRARPMGRPGAVRRPDALASGCEQVGHAAGRDDPEARVRRGRGLTKLLKEIPPLHLCAGRECSFPAALAVATKTEYDWLMGASGAAFDVTIDLDTFDPLA